MTGPLEPEAPAPPPHPGPKTAFVLLATSFSAALLGSWLMLRAQWGLWALVPVQVLGLLGPAFLWAWRAELLKEVFPLRPLPRRAVVAAVLMLAGATVAALALALAIVSFRGPEAGEEALRARLLAYPYPLRMALFALVPALCEEGLFRGAVLYCLRPVGRARACALSALAFAAFHLNVAQFLPVLALGLVFAWVVWETGSLWPSILGHGLHNALVLALLEDPRGIVRRKFRSSCRWGSPQLACLESPPAGGCSGRMEGPHPRGAMPATAAPRGPPPPKSQKMLQLDGLSCAGVG